MLVALVFLMPLLGTIRFCSFLGVLDENSHRDIKKFKHRKNSSPHFCIKYTSFCSAIEDPASETLSLCDEVRESL